MNLVCPIEKPTFLSNKKVDLNEKKRISAIQEIEKIAHENILLIHFWKRPFQLFLRHKQIQAPPSLGTKRGIDYESNRKTHFFIELYSNLRRF